MTTDFLPKIDVAKCTGCGLCMESCPNVVLSLVDEIAVIANPKACEYTGRCQEVCPTKAISLSYEIVLQKKSKSRDIVNL